MAATHDDTRFDLTTLPFRRSARRSRAQAILVCFTCLVIGVFAGHVSHETRAYASSHLPDAAAARAALGHRDPARRDARVALTLHAVARAGVRTKDATVIAAPPGARTSRLSRAGRAAAVVKAPVAAAADALFVDFEPTFRVLP